MIRYVEKENIFGLMGKYMMEIGKIIKKMEMVI